MTKENFLSEFDSSNLPNLTGSPLQNSVLDAQAMAANKWERVEKSQQIAVINAVRGFYFAKYLHLESQNFSNWTNHVAESAISEIVRRLWRISIIDVAMINDQNQITRAASLPGVLKALKESLCNSNDSLATSEYNSLNEISESINADLVPSLKYVRHLRNKWAGHPSMDLQFDSWAGADEKLNIRLVEDALAILIRAHQSCAEIIQESNTLRPLFTTPPPAQGADDSIPMTVHWLSVSSLAESMRQSVKLSAEALMDQLMSPPTYGSVSDRDWKLNSDHLLRRSLHDEWALSVFASESGYETVASQETIRKLTGKIHIDLGLPVDWPNVIEFDDSLALCALSTVYSLRSYPAAASRVIEKYRDLRQTTDRDGGPDLIRVIGQMGGPELFASGILQDCSKIPGTSRLRVEGAQIALRRLASLQDPVTTTENLRERFEDPLVKSAWLSVEGLVPMSWIYLLMSAGVETTREQEVVVGSYVERALGLDAELSLVSALWLVKAAANAFDVAPHVLMRAIWMNEMSICKQVSSVRSVENGRL